ncbi:MAG: hypothetical protein R3263_10050 [Myxococcota bacterium]|nr:hypothetical protein [Myxococcota bacterium]
MSARGRAAALLALGLGLALAGVAVWARLLAGGPVLPGVPGGGLRGEVARALPDDWSFANREDYLLVESRAWTLPWSDRVWFLAHEGRLHLLLPDFFGDGLQRRLADDPRVRVALDGVLYEQVAVPVEDDADLGPLVAPILRRQFAIEVEGPVRTVRGPLDVDMAVFRLEDPPR